MCVVAYYEQQTFYYALADSLVMLRRPLHCIIFITSSRPTRARHALHRKVPLPLTPQPPPVSYTHLTLPTKRIV